MLMTKFVGTLGVVKSQVEKIIDGVPSGIFEDQVEDYLVAGDILQHTHRNDGSDKVNGEVTLQNRFSIYPPASLLEEMNQPNTALYLKVFGGCWKVTQFQVSPPRLILTVGGKYDGKTAD